MKSLVNLKKSAILTAFIALSYSAIALVLNMIHAQQRPNAQYVSIESLDSLQHLGSSIRLYEQHLNGVSNDLGIASVGLDIGTDKYSTSEEVWVDLSSAKTDYRNRYMNRYRLGWLISDHERSLFVIETLQENDHVADDPQMQLWLIKSSGEIHHEPKIAFREALTSKQWQALFEVTYEAPGRALPALAAFLIAISILGILFLSVFKTGAWGVFCTLVCFLVPIIAGAPIISTFGWRYVTPAILLGFVVTSLVAALVASRLRQYQQSSLHTWWQRLWRALSVPLIALMVGVVSVVSLASVSMLPLDNLGIAVPEQLMHDIIFKPMRVLFEGLLGIVLLLAFGAGLYRYQMDKKLSS